MPKIATDPPVSEKQRRAMEAAAHGHSTLGIPKKVGEEFVGKDQRPGAGCMITTPDGRALFVRRSDHGDHPGTWAWPGGGIEDGETPEEAARRETAEETGYSPQGELSEFDHKANDEGTFTTFHHPVDEPFMPELNREHSAFTWAPLSDPPSPLHPGVAKTIDGLSLFDTDDKMGQDSYAFDRASVRSTDADGRMHVDTTNISKANVCPYMGHEIPDFRGLGLNPDKIYRLYRDPKELEKAVPTFNNLPVLSKHVEVNAANHRPDLLVGTTGSHAEFKHPYLRNSMAVWAQHAIDDIENKRKKELSSAYRYRADMTPGTSPEGEEYDGVMRDIIGNHVALVEEGRAGPDVVVGDSIKELYNMKVAISQKAMMVRGAMASFIRPRLAADAAMPKLAPLLLGVTGKNFKAKKPAIVKAVTKALEGKLAKDSKMDGLGALLDHLGETPVEDDMEPEDDMVLDTPLEEDPEDPGVKKIEKPDPMEAIMAFLEGKLQPEDMAQVEKLAGGGAEDEPPPFKGMPKPGGELVGKGKDRKARDKSGEEPVKEQIGAEDEEEEKVDKKAMDAAVEKGRKDAVAEATKNFQAIREAERAIRPYVGEVSKAFDSAGDVYKHALTALNVDIKDVPSSAYPAMLRLVPVPGSKQPAKENLGMDAASTDDFNKRFPNAKRIVNAV